MNEEVIFKLAGEVSKLLRLEPDMGVRICVLKAVLAVQENMYQQEAIRAMMHKGGVS